MDLQQTEKGKSLAWFKLADLIARGEREKALSVFRLLAHSLPDRAYALQLEGDILWYLDDTNATEKYKQAAFLYQQEKRWIEAIAVYEHLLFQHSDSVHIISELIIFYAIIDWQDKFQERFDGLLVLVNNGKSHVTDLGRVVSEVVSLVDPSVSSSKGWITEWLIHTVHNSLLPIEIIDQLNDVVKRS